MKNMRKIASVLLALVMVFALAAPVFAAETYSITINNTAPDHVYEAYQIFKGDLLVTGEGENIVKTLSNVQWGSSVTNQTGDATAIIEKMDTGYTGEDKITVDALLDMITLGEEVATSGSQSNGKYVIEVEEAGYYLVKDVYGTLNGKDDTYTEYLIKVVGPVEAAPKGNVPQVEKKVMDFNDTTGEVSGWQDSADHDIGDSVPFQLTATLANNVSSYSTYKVVFHDTLSEGLTYNNDAKVTFNGNDVTNKFTITCKNGQLTISCDNVKEFGATNDSVIVVEYTATLNDDAVIGSAGNPNEVYLEYSNNPNWDADGDGKPDEPGTPGDETPEEPTGKTPEDEVIVFTYKTIVNKVDENNNALAGATFELYKKTYIEDAEPEWVLVDKMVLAENQTTFSWTGLDDGEYMLHESVTPDGYNTVADIYFTITATHDEEAAEPKLLTLTVDNTNFTVDSVTGEAGPEYSGVISTDVINKSGVELPETGGMGTTLFYAFGAIMVLGAAVLLVTKKRMSIAE